MSTFLFSHKSSMFQVSLIRFVLIKVKILNHNKHCYFCNDSKWTWLVMSIKNIWLYNHINQISSDEKDIFCYNGFNKHKPLMPCLPNFTYKLYCQIFKHSIFLATYLVPRSNFGKCFQIFFKVWWKRNLKLRFFHLHFIVFKMRVYHANKFFLSLRES